MDLGKYLEAMANLERQEKLKDSAQLTLGELIIKLETIPDKTKSVVYDFGEFVPTEIDSWRGIYAELALDYDKKEPKTIEQILNLLKNAVGKTFEGYKGGDFRMGRNTPIWVANYSESSVADYKGKLDTYPSVAVVEVVDGPMVVLVTDINEPY